MYWPIGVVVVTVIDGVVVIAVPLTIYVNKYGDWKTQVNIILISSWLPVIETPNNYGHN